MKNNTIMLAGAMCLVAANLIQAEKAFDSNLNLGLSLTEGNAETLQGNAAITTEGDLSCGSSLRSGIEGNYGESKLNKEKETTVENARVFANVRRDFAKHWFVALNTAANYDKIAEIDYRALLGPALGGYLVKKDNLALTVEIGPSYVWEKVAEETDDFLALRIAERLEFQLSETAQIWQAAEYMPKMKQLDDFLLKAELGISAAINTRLHLRLTLQLAHDSTPGTDLEKNDFTLISGLGIKL